MAVPDHFVRPDVRSFLEQMSANPRPPFSDELIAMIRTLPPNAFPSMDLPVGELGEVKNLTMPGPGGDISLRLFDARAERAPGPVVVFYHGGGFCVGSVDTHAALTAEMARQLDVPVVSVEYRLAPEHPWPAAPDDAEAAARWIASHGEAFARRFTGLVLCGDSAGGTLAVVTALALRDRPAALPVQLLAAIYPKTDSSRQFESARSFGDGYGLDAHDLTYFEGAYRVDPTHWRGSPALADQQGLPPTLVVTASLDPLRDDGRAYAARTIAAGVSTTFREFEGTIHGFGVYRQLIPSARADLTAILTTMSELLRDAQR
jgi:acetyl esterase